MSVKNWKELFYDPFHRYFEVRAKNGKVLCRTRNAMLATFVLDINKGATAIMVPLQCGDESYESLYATVRKSQEND